MKILKTMLVLCLISAITSCSTTEKFTVNTQQGTKIYTPDNTSTPKGVASVDGKVNIEIPSDMYCGFILAQSPESNVKIPIGVDYKKNRHTGAKAAQYIGGTFATLGSVATVVGAIAMLASSSDDNASGTFTAVTAGGAAVALTGLGVGMSSDSRLKQTSYDYNFGYVSNQDITIPVLSSTLLNPNPPKSIEAKPVKEATKRKKASSGKEVVVEKPKSTKASRSRSDYAKKIEGTYIGQGTLLLDNNIDERYSEISVILERVDKTHVRVRILENGEDYFDSPLEYEIQKKKNGNISLTINSLPNPKDATIVITPDRKMTFTHKKVNIDNNIYTLEIVANME